MFYYYPYQTKFKSKRIQASNAPKKDFISTFNFLRDRENLWLATEFGFVRHRLQSDNYKLYRTDLLEYTLAKDNNGKIWGGGFEQGLLRYDRRNDTFIIIPTPFADSIWVHT